MRDYYEILGVNNNATEKEILGIFFHLLDLEVFLVIWEMVEILELLEVQILK